MKLTNRKAVEAQSAFQSLINHIASSMPMKYSMELALLSTAVDDQVEAFRKVRDSLIKDYQIKVNAGEANGKVTFTTTIEGKDDEATQRLQEKALNEFTSKINELMGAEGNEIPIKLHIPADIKVSAEYLKPVLDFIEVVDG